MELRNYKENKNVIETVVRKTIADELGIETGDLLLSINGEPVKDILDYKYLISDEYIILTIEKRNGDVWEYEIEKDYDEDIGITFTNPLIDKAKNCQNQCIFCFIDQLPKDMRDTLYFKDDDSRLSFLQGNFVTLTNMSDDEINRIIQYRISPINISVHTTDPDLRVHMMKNKRAGRIYEILERFSEAGIEMNCQIVLVPGVNDGNNLERTIKDLAALYPNVASVAVVPVGVTKFREGLYCVKTYNLSFSTAVVEDIHKYQTDCLEKLGTKFVFAADEFYVLSKISIPEYEAYEGFPQLENGVGLIRQFFKEIEIELNKIDGKVKRHKEYTIATGTLAYNLMKQIAKMIMDKFIGLKLRVIPITNNFFGNTITVSGLVTGKDIIEELENKNLKDGLIIPKSMLKKNEKIFLDDTSINKLEDLLRARVIAIEVDGSELVNFFINEER